MEAVRFIEGPIYPNMLLIFNLYDDFILDLV